MCNCSGSSNTPALNPASTTNVLSTQPDGPSMEQTGTFLSNLLGQPAVQQQLDGVRYRVMSTQAAPLEDLDKDAKPPDPPRWSSVIFDYTNNRTLVATADFPAATNVSIATSSQQPLPSASEWEEAAEIVRRDEEFSRFLICNLLIPY